MTEPVPLCIHCNQLMQLASENATTKSYVCGCVTPPYYHNIHQVQRMPKK